MNCAFGLVSLARRGLSHRSGHIASSHGYIKRECLPAFLIVCQASDSLHPDSKKQLPKQAVTQATAFLVLRICKQCSKEIRHGSMGYSIDLGFRWEFLYLKCWLNYFVWTLSSTCLFLYVIPVTLGSCDQQSYTFQNSPTVWGSLLASPKTFWNGTTILNLKIWTWMGIRQCPGQDQCCKPKGLESDQPPSSSQLPTAVCKAPRTAPKILFLENWSL